MKEKFIYVLNEKDRKELLSKGLAEVCSCTLNGVKAYCFENSSSPLKTFSEVDTSNYLFSSVAYFV